MFCRRLLPAAAILAAFFATPHVLAQQTTDTTSKPAPPPEWTEISVHPAEASLAPSLPNFPEIKIPNFTSCSIADLRRTVPELAHLEPAIDQSPLTALLDNIGAKTIDIANKTPNLISHEEVLTLQHGMTARQDFSFLVLQHTTSSLGRVFDEYRVDVKTGEKFQTNTLVKTAVTDSSSDSPDLETLPAGSGLAHAGEGPSSQGFVNIWLNFHPSNRKVSDFRYLGEEKMGGHPTLVVAFAQKPGRVPLPSMIQFDGKTFQVFMQGVAWVDPEDFKILRLRMDILAPPPGVPLRQLTSDVQFTEARISEVPSPLWLPREVVITSNVYGNVLRETHSYSDYRLFSARAKIVVLK